MDAKNKGVKEIILGLGGTGSSDSGLGLLMGLGAKIIDNNQKIIQQSENLLKDFADIDLRNLADFSGLKISALADVTNVYAGAAGVAKFFGRQKGGRTKILNQQEQSAQKVVKALLEKYKLNLQIINGSGAAGGFGGAIVTLGDKIEAGFIKIAQLLNLEAEIENADLIITGEGQMDFQTEKGKVPYGMAKLAEKYQVPTIAFCGALGDDWGAMNDLLLASFSV